MTLPIDGDDPLCIVVTELPLEGSLQLNSVAILAGDLPKPAV